MQGLDIWVFEVEVEVGKVNFSSEVVIWIIADFRV